MISEMEGKMLFTAGGDDGSETFFMALGSDKRSNCVCAGLSVTVKMGIVVVLVAFELHMMMMMIKKIPVSLV